jgi:DNA repair photolyase
VSPGVGGKPPPGDTLVKQSIVVRERECRSILSKSGIEGVDYGVNPYVGCAHACAYCYAVFMKRFTGHKEEWGTFVDLRGAAWGRLRSALAAHRPDLIAACQALSADRRPFHAALVQRTRRVADRHHFGWREVTIAYGS